VELRHESYTAVAGSGKLLSWSRFLLICLFSPLPSVSLLLQSPPLGIAPASVPSPRYRSYFSPLPLVSLRIQSPRRRGGRRAGATEQGRSPRGCHGGGAAAARVPRRRGGRRAGATEGLGAARVPRRGWAPRGCHGGGGRRAGATEGVGRRAGATEGAGAARVPRYRS